ncbi:MAG TPA: hypothetical protein VKT77_15390 [Chthonomonadaceae bacterium]|nr:hypothetical protein [Chthonomonadaceae bacterium]
MSAKNQRSSIGDYSTSPTGQGCLWTAAIGVMAVLGFSYLSAYTGVVRDPLDRVESGIAGVSKPGIGKPVGAIHAHRRARHRRVAAKYDE